MQTVYFQSAFADRFPLEIVGEQSYQGNIQDAAGYVDDDEKRFSDDSFSAELILDDANPYDKGNAVRVDIDGQTVGYLSKTNASKYRRALAALNLSDVVGKCGAAISGRKKDEFEDMNFGVWLDIDLENLKIELPSAPRPSQLPAAPQAANTSNPAPVAVTQSSQAALNLIIAIGAILSVGCIAYMIAGFVAVISSR